MPFGAKRVVSFDAFFDAEERCLVAEDDAELDVVCDDAFLEELELVLGFKAIAELETAAELNAAVELKATAELDSGSGSGHFTSMPSFVAKQTLFSPSLMAL